MASGLSGSILGRPLSSMNCLKSSTTSEGRTLSIRCHARAKREAPSLFNAWESVRFEVTFRTQLKARLLRCPADHPRRASVPVSSI